MSTFSFVGGFECQHFHLRLIQRILHQILTFFQIKMSNFKIGGKNWSLIFKFQQVSLFSQCVTCFMESVFCVNVQQCSFLIMHISLCTKFVNSACFILTIIIYSGHTKDHFLTHLILGHFTYNQSSVCVLNIGITSHQSICVTRRHSYTRHLILLKITSLTCNSNNK